MGYNPHANVCELFDFVKRQKYLSVKKLLPNYTLTVTTVS